MQNLLLQSVDKFFEWCNKFGGKAEIDDEVVLENDLDFAGCATKFRPIGQLSTNIPFTGTFNGNNHIIRNLVVLNEHDDAGFFLVVGRFVHGARLAI